uniref:Uncharacterized protein n=1 Tax=Glossina austeni TaxID=7395 RepID=A0A1A9V9Q6_GLOAU
MSSLRNAEFNQKNDLSLPTMSLNKLSRVPSARQVLMFNRFATEKCYNFLTNISENGSGGGGSFRPLEPFFKIACGTADHQNGSLHGGAGQPSLKFKCILFLAKFLPT